MIEVLNTMRLKTKASMCDVTVALSIFKKICRHTYVIYICTFFFLALILLMERHHKTQISLPAYRLTLSYTFHFSMFTIIMENAQ